ncbi:hypothetical protein [Psychroserpens sp.]|uniref:hypothetical protein n=1 Tax=Psychroserpens sp. TaxID=2020870 RepID=UPI001B23CAA0|nr:hypothetical protein [Psychroserpens sp.]MBO6607505.1 hypothetical protein [Psychroserpens sp.]MBO6654417.1 hypothetical protein [Psychroserpens sp.]MBO6681234.1 hypothetical protein [Psychroserpens sp.]MBO6749809.1 hypothetical protein [Psychroserpens sp.]MBO6916203.1 hypothetical protein [Psychroserpens sp.]
MKRAGIWIDKEKAHIVTLEGELEQMATVTSDIERYRVKGGTGSRFTSGPQDVIKDSTFLNREKQQFKNYFKAIISKVSDADQLVIFGPAGTNEKLKSEVDNNYKTLSSKVIAVVKADAMTDNQIKAWVRDFFASN